MAIITKLLDYDAVGSRVRFDGKNIVRPKEEKKEEIDVKLTEEVGNKKS